MPESPIPGSPSPSRSSARPKSNAAVVRAFYRLANDRAPESAEALAGFKGLGIDELARIFFRSQEIEGRLVPALRAGHSVWEEGAEPAADLVAWAARNLPLTSDGAQRVAQAGWSWPSLYLAIFSDRRFSATVGPAAILDPLVLATMERLCGVEGVLEYADADWVRGWARARAPGAGPVHVEIWIDGAFCAAGPANGFRRIVQDQRGGDGRVGFEIRVPARARSNREVERIEARAGPERTLIGTLERPSRTVDTARIRQIHIELASVRAVLERLESQLPAVLSQEGHALSDYADYFEHWYRDADETRTDAMRVAVWIDSWPASDRQLQDAVTGVLQQLTAGDHLVLVVGSQQAAFGQDLANRARLLCDAEVSLVVSDAEDAAERLAGATSSLEHSDVLLLSDGQSFMSGAALATITRAFAERPYVEALYFDEDAIDLTDQRAVRERRHVNPVLRPGFDRDLLLQTPYVGRTLAVRSATAVRLGLQDGCGGEHGSELLLRLDGRPAAVEHLPRVLVSRQVPAETQAAVWSSCVERFLSARDAPVGRVEPHEDVLGAIVPGAVRVRARLAQEIRTSVIVPTRDRLDLLRPCVDSLLGFRSSNRCEMDLIVIDHESREPETLAYLDDLVRQGSVRVMPFEGAFNWALMNNLAAAHADGDVLVFLNNDTVALTPDWLDELTSQALRPEVGVVGCRLLYADGTIQHAGFISRGRAPDFLIHDGVGVAGSDGGYLGRHALLHASPVVTGACMAVRTEVFRALGGFDAASFPLEGNDADLCYRARAEGLSVIYDPYATLYHLESKSRGFSVSGEDRATSLAAQALLRERWGERFGEDAGFNPHFDRTGRPFDRLRPPSPDFLLA